MILEKLEILAELCRRIPGENAHPTTHPNPAPPKPWWRLLPHEATYKDTGCDVSPSCLTCPREICVEDQPRGRQLARQNTASGKILDLLAQGHTQAQVAAIMHISHRTVRRYKERAAHQNQTPGRHQQQKGDS